MSSLTPATLMDSNVDNVNSREADAVPANGYIDTNCANDNSTEMGTLLASMVGDKDSRRSRSGSSLSSSLIIVHNNCFK